MAGRSRVATDHIHSVALGPIYVMRACYSIIHHPNCLQFVPGGPCKRPEVMVSAVRTMACSHVRDDVRRWSRVTKGVNLGVNNLFTGIIQALT